MKMTIINYRVGNLKSLQNALVFLDAQVDFASRPDEVMKADKIILPGVGAFGHAMANLRELDLEEVLKEKVESGTPILGICLGMQLLLTVSEENGEHPGLGFLPGSVRKLHCDFKIPHIGWNEISVRREGLLTRNLPSSRYAYFVHSYICAPDEAESTAAVTEYGMVFPSILSRDNVFGTQFHPEKSQDLGLQILQNFVKL